MEKELRTSIYYSLRFKERVVLEVLNGRLSAEGARKKYNIGGKMTVYRWLSAYKKWQERKKSLTLSGMKENKKERQEPQSKAQPQLSSSDEVTQLKKELKKALLQVEAYKMLLEIGKEAYGIDLEKKSGQMLSED